MAKLASPPRQYEMMIVIAPTVTEDGLPAVVDRVSEYVAEQGGTVASANYDNPWGRRRLAFKIQDFQDAYYVLYYLTVEPVNVEELERSLRLDNAIIRHLLIKYDPMTNRSEHDPFDLSVVEEPEPEASEPDEAEETSVDTEAEVSQPAESADASDASNDDDSEDTHESDAEADDAEEEDEQS